MWYPYIHHRSPLINLSTLLQLQRSLAGSQNMNTDQPFDPLVIPASRELALIHQKATLCREPINSKELCPCCANPVHNQLIDVCIDKIELAFLGQGIPLYLELTQLSLSVLALLTLGFAVPALVTNATASDCMPEFTYQALKSSSSCIETCSADSSLPGTFAPSCAILCEQLDHLCQLREAHALSYPNKQSEYTPRLAQAIIALIAVIVFKVCSVIIRWQQKHTSRECDRGLLSPSDFTAILSGLPRGQYSEEELMKELTLFCRSINEGVTFEIAKINIAFDITDIIVQTRRKIEIEKKLDIAERHFTKFNQLPSGFTEEQLSIWRKELISLKEKLDQTQVESKCDTTPVAFVTFQTQQQLQAILDHTKLSYWEYLVVHVKQRFHYTHPQSFYFKRKLVTIERAPEPNDVFWENCGYTQKYKVIKRIASWAIMLFLMGISFAVLIALDIAQYNSLSDNELILGFLSFLISLTIAIINAALYYAVTQLGISEKHFTKTHYDISVATKLILLQFTNSGLLVIATNILVQDTDQRYAFQKPGGIAADVFYITLINAFLTPLVAVFDPTYFYLKYQQARLEKQRYLTQIEANQLFEGPPFPLFTHYAHLGKTVWVTMLFAPLVPLALPFAVIGLFLYYWIQKILLLRRHSRPPFQSNDLNKEILSLLDLSPILLAIGQLWLDFAFPTTNTLKIINYISIGIAGLELFIPAQRITKIFLEKEAESHTDHLYKDECLKFTTDYDRANPITQLQAIDAHRKAVEMSSQKDPQSNRSPAAINTRQALEQYAAEGGEKRYLAKAIHAHMLKAQIIRKVAGDKSINQQPEKQPLQGPKPIQAPISQGQPQQNYISDIERIEQQLHQQGQPGQNLQQQLPYQQTAQYQQTNPYQNYYQQGSNPYSQNYNQSYGQHPNQQFYQNVPYSNQPPHGGPQSYVGQPVGPHYPQQYQQNPQQIYGSQPQQNYSGYQNNLPY